MPLRVRGHSPGPTEQYGTKGLRQSGFGAIQARINGNIGFRGNTPGKSNCRGTEALPTMKSAIQRTRSVTAPLSNKVVMERLGVTPEEEHSMKTLQSAQHRQAQAGPSRRTVVDERRELYLLRLIVEDAAAGRRARRATSRSPSPSPASRPRSPPSVGI